MPQSSPARVGTQPPTRHRGALSPAFAESDKCVCTLTHMRHRPHTIPLLGRAHHLDQESRSSLARIKGRILRVEPRLAVHPLRHQVDMFLHLPQRVYDVYDSGLGVRVRKPPVRRSLEEKQKHNAEHEVGLR